MIWPHLRDDSISCNQQRPLQIITPTVQHKIVNHKGRDKQRNRFEKCEIQRHVFVHAPPYYYHQGRHENRCHIDVRYAQEENAGE